MAEKPVSDEFEDDDEDAGSADEALDVDRLMQVLREKNEQAASTRASAG